MASTVNITADGSYLAGVSTGRPMTLVAQGAFGGGTMTVEVSPNEGTTWVAIGGDTTNTDSYAVNLQIGRGLSYRVTLASATAPNIDVAMAEVALG